jgi:hypothetical protein
MPIILGPLPLRGFVPFSELYPDIMPHVPGCPIPIVDWEIRRVAQDFMQRTKAMQVKIENLIFAAGDPTLLIEANEAEFDFFGIIRDTFTYDGVTIYPVTVQQLGTSYYHDWKNMIGVPSHYFMATPNEITLWPTPATDSAIGASFYMAITPKENATTLPTEFVKKYRQALFVGVRGRLMSYPEKPWTNMDGAAGYGQAYQGLVDSAAANVAKGHVASSLSSIRSVRWF